MDTNDKNAVKNTVLYYTVYFCQTVLSKGQYFISWIMFKNKQILERLQKFIKPLHKLLRPIDWVHNNLDPTSVSVQDTEETNKQTKKIEEIAAVPGLFKNYSFTTGLPLTESFIKSNG